MTSIENSRYPVYIMFKEIGFPCDTKLQAVSLISSKLHEHEYKILYIIFEIAFWHENVY